LTSGIAEYSVDVDGPSGHKTYGVILDARESGYPQTHAMSQVISLPKVGRYRVVVAAVDRSKQQRSVQMFDIERIPRAPTALWLSVASSPTDSKDAEAADRSTSNDSRAVVATERLLASLSHIEGLSVKKLLGVAATRERLDDTLEELYLDSTEDDTLFVHVAAPGGRLPVATSGGSRYLQLTAKANSAGKLLLSDFLDSLTLLSFRTTILVLDTCLGPRLGLNPSQWKSFADVSVMQQELRNLNQSAASRQTAILYTGCSLQTADYKYTLTATLSSVVAEDTSVQVARWIGKTPKSLFSTGSAEGHPLVYRWVESERIK
jgi:hypothetical protein